MRHEEQHKIERLIENGKNFLEIQRQCTTYHPQISDIFAIGVKEKRKSPR